MRSFARRPSLAAGTPIGATGALALAAEAAILACLLLSGLRLATGLEGVVDLGLFDETGYLYAGTHLPRVGLMPPAWSPLYGLWYYLLSLLQPDPVALYYLNYRLLAVGAPLLVYLLLRAYELPRLYALVVAWCFLVSMANLPIWPKPGSFALCLLLLLLIAARARPVPPASVLLLSLGALLASYARPEYLLAAGLLFALYLFLLWRDRGRLVLRRELALLIGALVAAYGLIGTFGLAPLDRNNNRSFEAFAQHYAINWAAWTGSPIDPWTEYDVAIGASFGEAESLGEAARVNPGAITRHLATNLAGYPGQLGQTFLRHFSPLLPADPAWAPVGAWLLAGVGGAALAWGLVRGRGELGGRLHAEGRRLAVFALLAAPALISALVIYPRSHYLLLHGVLLALVAGLLLAPRGRPGRGWLAAGVVTAVVLAIATPSIGDTWFAPPPDPSPHANRDTVAAIRSLGITAPTPILEAEGGFYVYLGDQFSRVSPEQKAGELGAFLDWNDVQMIVVSAKLRRDRRFADDPAWATLLADPAAAGFSSLPVPETDRVILYREPANE